MLVKKGRLTCVTLRLAVVTLGAGLFAAVVPAGHASTPGAGPYEANTESLRKHKAPQWYEDAKFGIFVHWGVFAVPAYHEWYVELISPKANYGFLLGGPPLHGCLREPAGETVQGQR